MTLLLCPDGLLVLAVLFATLAFAWTVRRRRASARLLFAGSAALFCGVLSTALVSTHVIVFLVTRASQRVDVPARIALSKTWIIAGVPYDMRLYSTILLLVVILVPAVRCIRAASNVTIGAADGWRSAVQASFMLIALSVPLTPLQPFAFPVAVAAFVSLEAGFLARRDLTAFAAERVHTIVTSQLPRLDSISAR